MVKKSIVLVVLGVGAVVGPAVADEDRGRLSGRAYLGRGDYVVGASVLVRPEDDASRLYLTTSDSRGQFRAEGLADGNYVVDVERVGVVPVAKSGIEVRHPFRAVVDLPMQLKLGATPAERETLEGTGTLSLTARVSAGGGDPVGEVRVRLIRPDGGADPVERLTASDGSVSLPGLRPGVWRIEASSVGFLPLRKHVALARDAQATIAMVRQPADYKPSALELMPLEEPLVPAALEDRTAK